MWWVKDHADHSRGGFQNRDVGRSFFTDDFGPDNGVDFARFADAPDLARDQALLDLILARGLAQDKEIIVRNGFVILKGQVASDAEKRDLEEAIGRVQGVRYVINQLKGCQ